MDHTLRDTLWREIGNDVNAAAFLLAHADCEGPLSDLPTAHPAVRLVLRARRHLLVRARRNRNRVLTEF